MNRGIWLSDTWRVAILALVVLGPLAAGFVWFATHLPEPTTDTTVTDAIVVLTGGRERVATGLALLEAGKAKRLFVSGVHHGVELGDLLKSAHVSLSSPELAGRIDLGHGAPDTVGNAQETAAWMRGNQFRTMRLVTADYHMRRALIDFTMAAPDITIWPNPVRPLNMAGAGWWHDRATTNLLMSEYGKYLVAKWRYTLARLTGMA